MVLVLGRVSSGRSWFCRLLSSVLLIPSVVSPITGCFRGLGFVSKLFLFVDSAWE